MGDVKNNRKLPFFDYKKAFSVMEDELIGIFRDVIRRGAFIMQKDMIEFERHLAAYLGVKHALGVGNATDGMVLAWRAVGLRHNDEVILPSHTMVASPASVHFAGGVPVLIDCGPDHLMDPDLIEAAITPRTRAIMPVQLNGRTCNMEEIMDIAGKHGLMIVEDAAQALGSRFKGKPAGTFGKAGTFSFYPAKLLGCLGDGGAVVTNDDGVADNLHMLRDHGRDSDGDIRCWGLNSRLDNLQAAILDFQFKDYQMIIDRRREIARIYQENLGDLSQLVLPPAPDGDPDHFDVYQNYEIEAERRDELMEHLRRNGVGTLVQWGGKAVHQFEKLGFRMSLPVTERMFECCVMLPMNMTISDEDVEYVCDRIGQFYLK